MSSRRINASKITLKGIAMKIATFLLAVLSLSFAVAAQAQAQAQNSKKVLIAYFSHTKTTEKVALEIHKMVGGDIFQIETIHPYPTEHRETLDVAEKERDSNARPALKAKVENMDSYDVIFLGYPIWWYTLPMPLFTFLESYDLSGKTIIPFSTHGGSRMSGTEDVIRKFHPKAKVHDGFAVSRNVIRNNPEIGAEKLVTDWLSKLKY
jgi:flavodoxin